MARKKNSKSPNSETAAASSISTEIPARARTLVFISHDSRDADLAEAFAHLLADVSAGTLKSFRSSDKKGTSGIEFGTEWYTAIMSQLGDATDVVALLTQRSVDRPWILYEAGVAKGKLDTNVLGVALGVPLEKVSTGPFGQFQNCADDEDSLTKLVIQLLQRNPDASPREEAVRVQVKVFLARAKSLLSAKGKQVPAVGTDETGIAKLFEEVKAMVRELPDRVDDRMSVMTRRSLKRRSRLHPGMLEELLMHPAYTEDRALAATAWLLFLSALRDDLPWLYEIGMDFYRALQRGEPNRIREARRNLQVSIDTMGQSPLFREILRPDDEDVYHLVRRLPRMLDRFGRHLDVRTRRRVLVADAKSDDEAKSK